MAFLNPSRVLNELDLKESFVAADFGSGSGGWVIPLAKKLKMGKVYAVEILDEPLSAMKSRLKLENISNVEAVKSNIENSTRILSNSCDLVLMTNLLFEIEDKKNTLEEGKRVLKNGGKLVIVDWKKDASMGPEERVSLDDVKKIAEEVDFKIEKELDAGLYHWGLLLVK